MIINTYFITDHFEEYFVPSEKSSYMDNPRRSKSKIFERTHLARISVAGIIKIHFAESSCQLIVFRCQDCTSITKARTYSCRIIEGFDSPHAAHTYSSLGRLVTVSHGEDGKASNVCRCVRGEEEIGKAISVWL